MEDLQSGVGGSPQRFIAGNFLPKFTELHVNIFQTHIVTRSPALKGFAASTNVKIWTTLGDSVTIHRKFRGLEDGRQHPCLC